MLMCVAPKALFGCRVRAEHDPARDAKDTERAAVACRAHGEESDEGARGCESENDLADEEALGTGVTARMGRAVRHGCTRQRICMAEIKPREPRGSWHSDARKADEEDKRREEAVVGRGHARAHPRTVVVEAQEAAVAGAAVGAAGRPPEVAGDAPPVHIPTRECGLLVLLGAFGELVELVGAAFFARPQGEGARVHAVHQREGHVGECSKHNARVLNHLAQLHAVCDVGVDPPPGGRAHARGKEHHRYGSTKAYGVSLHALAAPLPRRVVAKRGARGPP
mmetsp:Transcript_21103/g.56838  ORF Transcript_21103/g.56838 Transcript_21103/m.56838 type:complete len:280 (+) Transcript_21103:271-1110(+)